MADKKKELKKLQAELERLTRRNAAIATHSGRLSAGKKRLEQDVANLQAFKIELTNDVETAKQEATEIRRDARQQANDLIQSKIDALYKAKEKTEAAEELEKNASKELVKVQETVDALKKHKAQARKSEDELKEKKKDLEKELFKVLRLQESLEAQCQREIKSALKYTRQTSILHKKLSDVNDRDTKLDGRESKIVDDEKRMIYLGKEINHAETRLEERSVEVEVLEKKASKVMKDAQKKLDSAASAEQNMALREQKAEATLAAIKDMNLEIQAREAKMKLSIRRYQLKETIKKAG